MKTSFLSFLILAFMAVAQAGAAAEHDPNVFYGRSFSSSGDTLFYRVMYPKGYKENAKAKYPLVVILHGADSYSTRNQHYNGKQLDSPVAKLFRQSTVKDSFPSIVVLPQCEEGDNWAVLSDSDSNHAASFPAKPEQTYAGELLEGMVKYYIKHYQVDANRIYIIGMGADGGSGALDVAARNPKTFASIVSIGGAIAPARTKKLAKAPVRLYSSPNLKQVTSAQVRDVYVSLKANSAKTSDKQIELIEVPAGNEADLVKTAAQSPGFLNWIFSQKKK